MIKLSKFFAFAFLINILLSSNSVALKLDGKFEQGGLLVGISDDPNNIVTINNKPVKLDSKGVFVYGIEKDSVLFLNVKELSEAGYIWSKTYDVSKNTYKKSYVNGVPNSKVDISKEDMPRVLKENQEIFAARSVFTQNLNFLEKGLLPVEYDKYRITTNYGAERYFNGTQKSWHKGVDIAAPTGTAVIAPISGMVRLAKNDMFYTGGTIILEHGHSIFTLYGHLSKILVKDGDYIKAGDKIGEVGSTGRSTGPHLHFGLFWGNIALNPSNIVVNLIQQPKGNQNDEN